MRKERDAGAAFFVGFVMGFMALAILFTVLKRTPSHEWDRLHRVECHCDTVYTGEHR